MCAATALTSKKPRNAQQGRCWKHLVLVLHALLIAGLASAAPTVFVTGDAGQFGYFDLPTRAYTQVSSNMAGTGLGYRSSTGTMYLNTIISTTTALRIINPDTGAQTAVANYNYGAGVATNTIGISFNPTGSLYIYNPGNEAIFNVNPATAVGTQLSAGPVLLTTIAPRGKLAFAGPTLYGAMSVSPASASGLYSFNTSNGAVTSLGSGGSASTYVEMVIFADGATLYGLNGTTLFQINTANGALTTIGAITGGSLPAAFNGAVIGPARAATFTVSNLNDSGSGSLRQAITAANASAGADTIEFQAGLTGTINLSTRLPTFTSDLTINGPGPNALTVNGGNFTIFHVADGINLQMSGLRVTGGLNSAGLSAAQLEVGLGTANIVNSMFENANDSAGDSAAVASFATLTMRDVTIANATNHGLLNGGMATLTNVTITGCAANGVFQAQSAARVASIILINATVSNNERGIRVDSPMGLISTSITTKNSIFSNITADLLVNLAGGPAPNLVSQGNNIFSDATFTAAAPSDLINTDPLLDVLSNYGGSTRTMALRPGSPAINAGSATGAPSTDQRGFARVGATDIGAFESQGFSLTLASGSNQSARPSTNFASPLIVTANYVDGGPMNSGQVTFTPPASGASATIAGNPATIAIGGAARSGIVTANAIAGGPYTVSASIPGVTPVNFSLTNSTCLINVTSALDGTAPPAVVGIDSSITGVQTGRMNRFITGSTCAAPKPYPGTGVATGARAFDRYRITPATSGCVTVRITTANAANLFSAAYSSFDPAVISANYIADPGFANASDIVYSFNATANVPFDLVVHEVNVGGGLNQPYSLAVDACTAGAVSSAFSINDASIAEGNSGNTALSFTVSRSNTIAAQSVDIASSIGGTASAGTDYTALPSSTLNFGPGVEARTVTVQIVGDAIFETNETFNLALSNASAGSSISDASGIGTINNDDSAPTLAINDASINEGNSGTQSLLFTVTRTGLTELPVNFSAATADGTASAPVDYLAALSGLTTIPPGSAAATTTLTATINGDSVPEADETFFINLSAATNATIVDNQGQGSIINDDVDFIFSNGFEDQTINATHGSFSVPSAALRSVLDASPMPVFSLTDSKGEALRIYARALFGVQQFALATRDGPGKWSPGAWQQFDAEPRLSWTATRSDHGFVLSSAVLR